MRPLRLALLAALVTAVAPTWAASHSFEVVYQGGGLAALVPGSTDPRSVTLLAGDSFSWTISALPGHQWTVLAGGTVFPMMALAVREAAQRTSDHVLTLTHQGTTVLSMPETGSVQSQIHMGTNTVSLAAGMVFDRLHLGYDLISAIHIDTVQDPADPGRLIDVFGDPVGTTPLGLLPFYGMLDATRAGNTSQTVYAPVPEPASWALWLAGLGLAGALARRRRPA